MIDLTVIVEPKVIKVSIAQNGVDWRRYHENPRFVADGLRVYMPKKHCGLSGRYHALVNVIMSFCYEHHIPISSLVDTHKRPIRRDRRSKALREAHEKTRRLL